MGLALLVGFELGRLALLVAQIVRHLCSKHPLVKPLGQLLHDPSRTGQIFRSLVALHQLFYDGRIDLRLLAFLALLYSLLLLGHFHLLSQVVTHTQILRHPPYERILGQNSFTSFLHHSYHRSLNPSRRWPVRRIGNSGENEGRNIKLLYPPFRRSASEL